MSYDPVTISPNTKASKFWFFLSFLLVLFVLIQPSMTLEKYKAEKRLIVLDEIESHHVAPLPVEKPTEPLVDYMLSVATQALLNRGPLDVDNPPLLDQLYKGEALTQAKDFIKIESDIFRKKKLHQKVEMNGPKILKTKSNIVLGNVTGQLIRVGTFEGQKFTDTKEFSLKITLKKNKKRTANGRMPFEVVEWEIEKRDALDLIDEKNPVSPISTVTSQSNKENQNNTKYKGTAK